MPKGKSYGSSRVQETADRSDPLYSNAKGKGNSASVIPKGSMGLAAGAAAKGAGSGSRGAPKMKGKSGPRGSKGSSSYGD